MVDRFGFNGHVVNLKIEPKSERNASKNDHQGENVASSVGVNWPSASISCQDDVAGKSVKAQLRHSLPRLLCADVSARGR
jgi:hypothetical protein